jgi:SSS family solute:Na+ symporter
MQPETINFGWINWIVVAGFLCAATWLGERLKTKGDDLNSFFKGGNGIPWWAVSLSLIATKTSASTFIAVPAFIFAASGNLTYLQASIGFIAGVFLMLFFLLKEYYNEDIYSPYDFIEKRLGVRTGHLTRIIYTLGTVLSQGVRLLVTAVVLSVVSGQETVVCVMAITLFAIIWSYIGGISTVIWTDAIQYIIFTLGALVALIFAISAVPGGIPEVLAIADEKAKLTLIDFSMDPTKLTLWAAVIGCTFFEFGSTAVDQTITQRALCCANLKEARKAVAFSAIGVITTWLMAAVALAMVAFYHVNPMAENVAKSMVLEPDRIFPYFVISQLPQGVSGIIIAAIFAAGISTLDSALTALSQTSVVGLGRKLIPSIRDASESTLVKLSRRVIIVWGLAISALAIAVIPLQEQGLLALGFKATGFIYGSLIGISVLALMRRGSFFTIVTATVIATFVVVWLDTQSVNFFWWYPIGACVTIGIVLCMEAFITKRNKSRGLA